jgi:hypothetical protein
MKARKALHELVRFDQNRKQCAYTKRGVVWAGHGPPEGKAGPAKPLQKAGIDDPGTTRKSTRVSWAKNVLNYRVDKGAASARMEADAQIATTMMLRP